MIFLRISSQDEGIIEDIARLLLKEKLAIDVNIKRHTERLNLKDGQLHSTEITLLTAKTKALLFSTIDEKIRSIYPDELLEIYSLPIVHMDWEDARHLREDLQVV